MVFFLAPLDYFVFSFCLVLSFLHCETITQQKLYTYENFTDSEEKLSFGLVELFFNSIFNCLYICMYQRPEKSSVVHVNESVNSLIGQRYYSPFCIKEQQINGRLFNLLCFFSRYHWMQILLIIYFRVITIHNREVAVGNFWFF